MSNYQSHSSRVFLYWVLWNKTFYTADMYYWRELHNCKKKTFKRLLIQLWKLLSILYVYLIRSLTLMFHHNDKFRVFFVVCLSFSFSLTFTQTADKVNRSTNSLYFLVKLSHYKCLRRKLVVLPPSATNSSIRVQKPRGIMNIARVAFNIWSIVTCTWLH